MFVRIVRVPSSTGTVHEYVRIVEAERVDGRAKQRVIANLGRRDVLDALMPQLYRAVRGEPLPGSEEADDGVKPVDAVTWGPALVAQAVFTKLGLWEILERHLGKGDGTLPYADRVFALICNRLTSPTSEHGLARWLETNFICDRRGRRIVPVWSRRKRVQVAPGQLQLWYRTLDRLVAAKEKIEVDLYLRLRDLFSLQPDLVFFDITSTYFEGKGPAGLAKHGYSRDKRPRSPQVVVGVVMVNGWPIAHHVFPGNTTDKTTVKGVVADLQQRFSFKRIVFVGDRGMVTAANLEELEKQEHGYLVGIQRRRNPKLQRWLEALRDDAWIDCPVGIAAGEQMPPPRTRVQEVNSGKDGMRVFVVDSEERTVYEQAMRERAMARARLELESVAMRVSSGQLKDETKIGAAAARALQRHHGHRYFDWKLQGGEFTFFEHPTNLPSEKRYEGKFVIATTEAALSPVDAVQAYKDLNQVENCFRQMKDLAGLRPVFHQTAHRTRGHIFVAALGFLAERLIERTLKDARVDLSSAHALQALESIRHVTFDVAGKISTGTTPGTPRAREVLAAFGIRETKPPEPPEPGATVTGIAAKDRSARELAVAKAEPTNRG